MSRVMVNGRDVTEGVKTLYDHVLASLDFGSGFLGSDEVIEIADLAEACGFDISAPRSYLVQWGGHRYATEAARKEAERAKAWLDAHPEASS